MGAVAAKKEEEEKWGWWVVLSGVDVVGMGGVGGGWWGGRIAFAVVLLWIELRYVCMRWQWRLRRRRPRLGREGSGERRTSQGR